MVRVDRGTRGDEWCVWTEVREETNGVCGKRYERKRMVRVDSDTRGDEWCVWTEVREETNGACGQ